MSTPTRRYHIPSAIRRSSRRIDPEEARTLIAEGAMLIDVRRNDVVDVPLEGVARISPDEIPEQLGELPRDRPIILVCT